MRIHEDLTILGIESSCDETSAAVVSGGWNVLSNVIASQIEIHERYGGVVPEIASRKHIEVISQVVDVAVREAGLRLSEVDALSVTCGPGLVGALLIGLSYAKALAYSLGKPLVGVNHIHGHICSNYLGANDFTPPFICLVVSGGHTNIVHVHDYDRIEILGRTADDAAGEAFDKVARAIGLGYPGGPRIDALAKTGDPMAFDLPTAFNEDGNLNFSFSGLKSAVLNLLNKAAMKGEEIKTEDLAAAFQKNVVKVLVKKAVSACNIRGVNKLALAGGVSCNSALRASVLSECEKRNITVNIPPPVYCTDNAAMIASCGFYNLKNTGGNFLYLNAYPNMELSEPIITTCTR